MSAWWTPLVKPALNTLKEILKIAQKGSSKKKYNELLSSLIAELLKQHPDINAAEAKAKAIEAIGVPPTKDFFQAQKMLREVKSFTTKGRTAAMGKAARVTRAKKTIPKKKVAVKKKTVSTVRSKKTTSKTKAKKGAVKRKTEKE